MLHSIEHCFHCLDIDGDGCLSLYEMEQFYSEMVNKMKSLGIEGLLLAECMCQVCVHGQLTPHERTYIHTHSPPPPMVHHKCIGTFALLTPLSKVLNVDGRAVCTASVGLSVHVNWLWFLSFCVDPWYGQSCYAQWVCDRLVPLIPTKQIKDQEAQTRPSLVACQSCSALRWMLGQMKKWRRSLLLRPACYIMQSSCRRCNWVWLCRLHVTKRAS